MFTKLSLFAAIAAPLASALILQTPTNPTSGGSITISWTNEATDTESSFDLYLTNDVFHNTFAIANTVDPSLQQLTLTLPVVPNGDGYTIEATNISNINDIYAQTSSFSIGPTSSSGTSTGTGTGTTTTTVPTVSTLSTLSQISTLITTTTPITTNTSPSGTSTGTSSIPTVKSSSGASRRLGFTIGGMAAAIFAIGGVAILAL